MGKAKSVRNLAFLSPVLLKLDGVLLFFRLFGALVIYMPCCDLKTLTSVIFFTAMPPALECCKKTTLSGRGMLRKNNTDVAKTQHGMLPKNNTFPTAEVGNGAMLTGSVAIRRSSL